LERASGLLSTLVQTSTSPANHHASLTAVLLRRDILRMTDAQAVEPMIGPLLECFLQHQQKQGGGGGPKNRISIGHCLAEICGTVSLLSPSPKDKEQVMARILNSVSNAVSILYFLK
jgi:hypothetical protein